MQSTFSLRDYQLEAVGKGGNILKAKGLLILNYEVRTGKSHIALSIGSNYSNVLFVTKLKAISSIEKDYATASYTYPITIINYEQLHKYKPIYDLVIFDESHSLAAFPKATLKYSISYLFPTTHLLETMQTSTSGTMISALLK